MEFKEYKIQEFLDDLSSDSPSPGGGSTAALVGALAGALNSMVYSLTIGKKCYENLDNENKNKMLRLSQATQKFINQSIAFMEKDRQVFNALMSSFRLPKETDEDKVKRAKEIERKTLNAMSAPFDFAVDALAFYRNIEFAVNYGNKNLVSDAGVAAILLHAAIESAIINVKINYASLKDNQEAREILTLSVELLEKSLQFKNDISQKVERIILGE